MRKHYQVRRKGQRVVVTFQTTRFGQFFVVLVICALVYEALHLAFSHHWNEDVLAGMVGGAISIIAIVCFSTAERIVHWSLEISPDLVSLQKTFQGVPVGRKQLHARNSVTDLGFYPVESKNQLKLGTLCLWIDGKSFELESLFFIAEGVTLAQDLSVQGVVFPRTHLAYDPLNSLFNLNQDYLSF